MLMLRMLPWAAAVHLQAAVSCEATGAGGGVRGGAEEEPGVRRLRPRECLQ